MIKIIVSGKPIKEGRSIYFESRGELIVEKELFKQVEAEFVRDKNYWKYGYDNTWNKSKFIKMLDIDSYLCDRIKKSHVLDDARDLASWFYDFSDIDDLVLNSLCIEPYKGNDYFVIKMDSMIKYNESKLSDYDIAKRLFISPIIDYVKSSKYIT